MSGRVVGLDVGGTKIAAGWIEDDVFALGDERPTRTDAGAEGLLDQLVEMIGAARGPGIRGVGLGVPSVIEWTSGRVKSSVNIPLKDVPLRHALEERLDLPVFVDNDATVAALAEAHDGTRFTVRDLVMFTVGTGVGGGLVIGGRVFRGRTGAAGELGHMLVGLGLGEGRPRPSTLPSPARWSPSRRGRSSIDWRTSGSGSRAARWSTARWRGTARPRRSCGCSVSAWASGSPTPSTRSTPRRS